VAFYTPDTTLFCIVSATGGKQYSYAVFDSCVFQTNFRTKGDREAKLRGQKQRPEQPQQENKRSECRQQTAANNISWLK